MPLGLLPRAWCNRTPSLSVAVRDLGTLACAAKTALWSYSTGDKLSKVLAPGGAMAETG